MMAKKSGSVKQYADEDEELAKVLALSLKEAERMDKVRSSTNDQRSRVSGHVPAAASKESSNKKVRALYDFEAVEDNELTFKAGEIILVLDDSGDQWWRGSNHRGEGLFPCHFVTTDLSVMPEQPKKKVVNFNEEVQVVNLIEEPAQDSKQDQQEQRQPTIDPDQIDRCLRLIEEADPTGELRPDPPELAKLETICRQMGPVIDQELEKIDKHNNMLCDLNVRLTEAFQLYSDLMPRTTAPNMGVSYALPQQQSAMFNPGYQPLPGNTTSAYSYVIPGPIDPSAGTAGNPNLGYMPAGGNAAMHQSPYHQVAPMVTGGPQQPPIPDHNGYPQQTPGTGKGQLHSEDGAIQLGNNNGGLPLAPWCSLPPAQVAQREFPAPGYYSILPAPPVDDFGSTYVPNSSKPTLLPQ